MTPNEFQQLVLRTANTHLPVEGQLANVALGLVGEAAEFSELIKKHLFHGHVIDADKAKKELGDVLWYLSWACQIHGFTMEDCMIAVIEKLKLRYPNGFNSEDSVARVDVTK